MKSSRLVSRLKPLGRVALMATTLGLLAAGAAQAEGTAAQREACTPDALRLCASEIPDVGRVKACMAANRSRLGARCLATLESPATAPRATIVAARHRAMTIAARHAHQRPVALARHPRHLAGFAMGFGGHHHGRSARMARLGRAMAIAAQVMGGLRAARAGEAGPAEVRGYQRYIPMGLMGGFAR